VDQARPAGNRGRDRREGQTVGDLLVGYPAVIVDSPATDALLPATAYARYGTHRVRLRQIVWPDRSGRFPWHTGYGYDPRVQPLIGRP
jgi:hypothetical protein